MQFDLISDLHIERWSHDKQINWEGLGTSLVAVIAGDVSLDLNTTYSTVLEISKHYRHTIFVDGNHEHAGKGNIHARKQEIANRFGKYRNISYLFKNTLVLDGTAFIGANGWYSYDFCEPYISKQDCIDTLVMSGKDQDVLMEQWNTAIEDAEFLSSAVMNCSADSSIKDIVLITHTLPHQDLTWMPSYDDIASLGLQGSSYLQTVSDHDVNSKIKVWCYGHVHQANDRTIDGIRYVSNPRGLPGQTGAQEIYYPKYIKN